MPQKYWLVKTEPEVFSIQDLAKAPKKTTYWDGVRNYQARNFLRDSMKKGEKVLIYHSNSDPSGIVGVGSIVKEGYPDFTAWDSTNPHFDEGSTENNPRWYMVDIKLEQIFPRMLELSELKQHEELAKMELLRKGSRLSVQPVLVDEYEFVLKLANEG